MSAKLPVCLLLAATTTYVHAADALKFDGNFLLEQCTAASCR